ncbi:MAG: hypothetical protein IJP54_05035, partial [Synergistaceae bacterium]|nr:hypothetical protein [Synergistaceae bacterium]
IMSDDYVRKDLYDEGIKRIEALMAASEARHQAELRELRAISDGLADTVAAYADMTNRRIDDLIERDTAIHRRFDRFMNFMMLIAGIAGAIVAGVQLYLAFKG